VKHCILGICEACKISCYLDALVGWKIENIKVLGDVVQLSRGGH
jgi:hypothetical protein